MKVLASVLATAIAALALAGIAAAIRDDENERWTRISTGPASNPLIAPSLALDAGKVVVASLRTDTAAEAATFSTSTKRDVVGLARHQLASAATGLVNPHLLPKPGGGLQALVEGIPPLGISFSSRNRDGSFGAPVVAVAANTPRATQAGPPVLVDGVPVWPAAYGGQLWVWRGATGATGASLEASLPTGNGGAGAPALALDRMGRVWLAWNLIPPSGKPKLGGLYMVELDPVTLKLVGRTLHAPGSDKTSESWIAIACSKTCRLVYQQLGAPDTRIVSWAPGEAAATLVVRLKGMSIVHPTAAYANDGRLWVAWWNSLVERYEAKLGNGVGGGGAVIRLGRPGKTGTPRVAGSIASGRTLVVVVSWDTPGMLSSRYVNVVSSK
jgi:hypothetical protein